MSFSKLSEDLRKLASTVNDGKDAKEFLRKSGNKLKKKL